MATLTQTAYYTRKAINFGIIALIGFIVLKTALTTAGNIWRKFRPPPPPPPTVDFGKLPKIKFPEQGDLPELSFQLETIEGALPSFSTIGKVYFMPRRGPGLLALDRAKERARSMGFTSQPEAVSDIFYRWRTGTEPATILEININTLNFHLRYAYEEDPTLLTDKNIPTNERAAAEAKSFLQHNNYLSDDLAEGSAEFAYFRFLTPNLVSAISLSEADFVRANLFRADLDDLKILPPNPVDSLVSFLFSGSRERWKRIVEVKYTYAPIDRETFATYPLKPVNTAWQEIQGREGFIANLGQNEGGRITIRAVYLAFYDSSEEQNFLQPVYVFEGDRNFFGYVPAIDPQWQE